MTLSTNRVYRLIDELQKRVCLGTLELAQCQRAVFLPNSAAHPHTDCFISRDENVNLTNPDGSLQVFASASVSGFAMAITQSRQRVRERLWPLLFVAIIPITESAID